jgi:serine/threonine protein phosphatase PrpC
MFEWACRLESYRPASEDRTVAIPTRDGLVVAVADGVGGQSGGGAAAERLIEVASEAALQGATRTARDWAALLGEADGALLRDPAAGQTTAVVLCRPIPAASGR